MRDPGRRHAILLLLCMAVGLFAAGVAAAAGSHDVACCPSGMESAANGCTWLGAGDCCPQRPGATAPSHAAPPAAPCFVALNLSAPSAGPALLPANASPTAPNLRSTVLRL
jgi:hypothetical protein